MEDEKKKEEGKGAGDEAKIEEGDEEKEEAAYWPLKVHQSHPAVCSDHLVTDGFVALRWRPQR